MPVIHPGLINNKQHMITTGTPQPHKDMSVMLCIVAGLIDHMHAKVRHLYHCGQEAYVIDPVV